MATTRDCPVLQAPTAARVVGGRDRDWDKAGDRARDRTGARARDRDRARDRRELSMCHLEEQLQAGEGSRLDTME